ncbi:MAG: hypothetical protein ACYS6I_05565 [Planctomycetota bacterium]|jgi:hypothetical protein
MVCRRIYSRQVQPLAVKKMLAELETPAEVELLVSGELSDGTIFWAG